MKQMFILVTCIFLISCGNAIEPVELVKDVDIDQKFVAIDSYQESMQLLANKLKEQDKNINNVAFITAKLVFVLDELASNSLIKESISDANKKWDTKVAVVTQQSTTIDQLQSQVTTLKKENEALKTQGTKDEEN